MNDNHSTTAAAGPDRQPHPWERQPDERLDRYRWFQVYLTLPLPRTFKSVTHIVGLKPGSRLVARAARDWRWKERTASAAKEPAFLPHQQQWRNLLLDELAYIARFNGLAETSRALAGAALGQLDRVQARRRLGPLIQYQRGLLRLLATPKKEDVNLDIHPDKLRWMVSDRAIEIRGERFNQDPVVRELWGPSAAEDTEDAPAEEPAEPWHQQPGEQDNCFYWFRIYLSLMFFQSTAQVAAMANTARHAALAKIARKWHWQERAAAFDAHNADRPFARTQLQLDLFSDKAFEAHLHGLLESTRALKTAEIDRLDRAKARRLLTPLFHRQRSLLQFFWRQSEVFYSESPDERRQHLLLPLVEKLATEMVDEEEADPEHLRMMKLIWGGDDDEEDDEDDEDDKQ
ncbi:MAG: hypothetical protein OXJ55_09860 [Caldilineaceae bacterium]|nr:hypothetical protein [Caldilineaceae bacterium]MDE0462721.1 hypothetical protein [Caldilineaceae bacterium]